MYFNMLAHQLYGSSAIYIHTIEVKTTARSSKCFNLMTMKILEILIMYHNF